MTWIIQLILILKEKLIQELDIKALTTEKKYLILLIF